MKLIRSQIASELNNRLFEISAKVLPERGIIFLEDTIQCTISSKNMEYGFCIWGKIHGLNEYVCIRCLKPYLNNFEVTFKVILSHKKDLKNQNINEILFFPLNKEKINLGELIADKISLDEPMNPLCKIHCKGLCPQCGININKSSCDCKTEDSDSTWDKLKKINFDLK